ncbi:Nitronate monooxygenase [Pleurostoma richardsiae]|uniref:Nitronate monooxygenase n=1 Tax=Pleurostoma richardsiae TaxID=41990 RepID=A0AA38S572_9PEZI|nr:Nitronate monooxygenase [Pleurostoma richardsiae]
MAPKEEPQLSRLQTWFPNTKRPVIISAPMLNASNGTLAAQVSKAGGFGIIPGGADFTPGSAQLAAVETELITARSVLGLSELTLTPIPVGVGFITASPSVAQFAETALPILEKHMPQAVWLFAPNPDAGPSSAAAGGGGEDQAQQQGTHARLIPLLRDRGFKVFVQVGTVAAARQAVRDGADVVVAQGTDAGGHQFASGASVVSLVPEVRAMLDGEFPDKELVLVAAGGISHPSSVVAALALGAEAAVMGTRFLVANEASTPEWRRKLLLETKDGGASTIKSTFHDDVQGTKLWPSMYDGRAIIGESYKDHVEGLSLEENAKKHAEAKEAGESSRLITWAGTGVGLVNEAIPAGDIVRNTREGAKQQLQKLRLEFDDGEEKHEKSWIKELGHTLYKHR